MSKVWRDWVAAIVAGVVVGAVILGLVGRLAMAGMALAMGRDSNLSLRSVFEVVVLAMVVGAVGGVIRQVLGFWLHKPGVVRGVSVGVSLFVLSGMLSWWAGGGGGPQALTLTVPTLLVVAALYILFGITIEKYMSKRR